MIPKPFTRVRIVYSPPIRLPAGERAFDAGVDTVQRALDEVTANA